MIGCKTKNGIEYITKLEHFRGLMSENTYQALKEFLNNQNKEYQEQIDDLEDELNSLQEETDDLENDWEDSLYDKLVDGIHEIIDNLSKFSKEKIIEKLKELV